ncbi:EGF-like domain protein [Dictyocaulus viviparus]|uniref:EGF-like domain protein n=1 Tax=Dictyocaulus viviparus TaxID=29172 RepID=A0A0D8XEP3_DICVI|nr:EGF-like domain protein [Dictyocaulus viviparus]
MWMLLLILPALHQIVVSDESASLCGSVEAQAGCSQCIKQHPDCAWCRDPHTTQPERCQVKSAFKPDTCNPTYVYSPATEIRVGPHNKPLGSPGSGKSIVQIEPQQVVLRMKPGDSLNVSYKYLHRKPPPGYDVKDFMVQTSDYKKLGVNMEFFVDCNGQEIEAQQCPKINEGQKLNFKIKVTLLECRDGADIAISVGVHGYTTVSALYITPLCGCECEKLSQQEKNSPLCHQHGHLICGQCVCESTRGGDKCECPLATYGVKNAVELEDKCRETQDAPICSGQGLCRCGQCQCNLPTVSGRFCQCDNSSCPVGINGRQCSGNGICECKKCRCEEGWEHEDCSCTTSSITCMDNGLECSGNGHCKCGKCICDEGFNGAFCGSDDEKITTSLPEKEKTSEEESLQNDEVADVSTTESISDAAMTDENTEESAATPETAESNYVSEPGTPEEVTSSSYGTMLSLVTLFAFMLL